MPSPEREASPPPPAWLSRLRTLQLVALLLAAAWAIVFHARLPGRLPDDASYAEVAKVIAAERQPGDVVLLQPWWTERARLFLAEDVPVVGHLHSDDEPLTDHPRIWLLAQPNLPKAGTSDFLERFGQGRERQGDERVFGNLHLSLWKNGRHRPARFSLAASLAQARVYLEDPRGGRADCPWNGRQHQCPQAGHLRAAREWHEVNQIPRECVYLHPPGGDGRLVVELPSVPPGERLQLEGGIIWELAAKAIGYSDVSVSAEVNGSPLLGFVAKAGEEALYRTEAPSPPQPFALRIAVAASNPSERQLCVDFFSRGPAQQGAR